MAYYAVVACMYFKYLIKAYIPINDCSSAMIVAENSLMFAITDVDDVNDTALSDINDTFYLN